MAFGEGFLRGFTVGNNYRIQQEEREFINSERERMALERDAQRFHNAYSNLRGGRSAEEFAKSGDLDRLVWQFKDNKFVNDLVNDGVAEGKRAELSNIAVNPETGLRSFEVDTYDDQGRLISKNRPVTLGRRSREEGPGDDALLLTGDDFHNYIVAELGQYDFFNDRWGSAKAAATSSGLLYDAMFGDPEAAASRIDQQFAEAQARVDELPEEEQREQAAAVVAPAEAVQEDLPEIEGPNDLVGLNRRIEALEARREAHNKLLGEKYARPPAIDSPEALEEYRAQLEADPDWQVARDEAKEIRELRKEKRRIRNEVLADPQGETAQAVAEGILDTTQRPIALTISNPEVAAASRADKQALQAGYDKGQRLGSKPANRAQANAILRTKREAADRFIAGQRQSKKDFENYVRALSTQVARGDITAAEMSNSVAGFLKLKATIAKGSANIKTTTANGRIVWWNEATGEIINQMDVPKQSTDSDSGSYLTTLKKVIDLRYPDRDDPRRQGALSAIDQTANVLDLGLDQDGAYSLLSRAIEYRDAAIHDAASMNLFVSVEEAEDRFPSLTPFVVSQQLGVQKTEVGDFMNEMSEAFGSAQIPEAVWRDILTATVQLVREQKISPEEAKERILRRFSEFQRAQ